MSVIFDQVVSSIVVDRQSSTTLRHIISTVLDVNALTLAFCPAVPGIWDHVFYGHQARSVVAVFSDWPGRAQRLARPDACILDLRPILRSFQSRFVSGPGVDIEAIVAAFTPDCPPGFHVSVFCDRALHTAEGTFATIVDGNVLTVEFIEDFVDSSSSGATEDSHDQGPYSDDEGHRDHQAPPAQSALYQQATASLEVSSAIVDTSDASGASGTGYSVKWKRGSSDDGGVPATLVDTSVSFPGFPVEVLRLPFAVYHTLLLWISLPLGIVIQRVCTPRSAVNLVCFLALLHLWIDCGVLAMQVSVQAARDLVPASEVSFSHASDCHTSFRPSADGLSASAYTLPS